MTWLKEFLKPNGRKIIIFFLISVAMFGGSLYGIKFVVPVYMVLIKSFFGIVSLIPGVGFDPGPPPIIMAPVFITVWILYFYPLSCLIYFIFSKIFKRKVSKE